MELPLALRKRFPSVTEVVDSDVPIEVNVQEGDASGGEQYDPEHCAMARALCRDFKATAAVVGLSTSYVIVENKAYRFDTPESVAREITTFDRSQSFQPGSYYLRPKSPASRLGISHPRTRKDTSGPRDVRTDKRRTVRSPNARFITRKGD